jgi:hypothetical protein
MPLQLEYDLELNWKDIEKFLIFPTVICAPLYDNLFRSCDFLKSTELLKFCPGQNQMSREIWAFDSKSNSIAENFQYQPHR